MSKVIAALIGAIWLALNACCLLQEAKQSISKRKASDAASPALDAALATAAAEETSPSKRMKSASDPANPSQVLPPPHPLAAVLVTDTTHCMSFGILLTDRIHCKLVAFSGPSAVILL